MNERAAIFLATAALWSGQSLAQTPAPISDTELSKDVENPVTRQITLPLRYEGDFQDGAYDATKDTFEIDQAVVPFRLNDDWALITRTKLPAESLPPKKFGEHWTFGLSNDYTTFFLSPKRGEGFYWGARLFTIRRRRTRRSAATNGVRVRRRLSCTRMRALGISAPSSTTSGPLAAQRTH